MATNLKTRLAALEKFSGESARKPRDMTNAQLWACLKVGAGSNFPDLSTASDAEIDAFLWSIISNKGPRDGKATDKA